MGTFKSAIPTYSCAVLLTVGVGCVDFPSTEEPVPDQQRSLRPNIVLVVIETLRPEFLGCYNPRSKLTPQIDRLAEDAVLFENAIAQSSWTRPSVAALLTSTHPSTNGVVGPTAQDVLSASFVTMAEALQASGYDTFAVSTNSNLVDKLGFAQGYQVYNYAQMAPAPLLNLTVKNWLNSRNSAERPFFVHLHYEEPHGYIWNSAVGEAVIQPPRKLFLEPPDPESSLKLKSTIVNYQMKIRQIDAGIGELIDQIESHTASAQNLRDTLIILTSDHGEELLDHGGFWHGFTLYPEVTHVPLLIRHPKWAKSRVSEAVQHIDILPTVLNLINAEVLRQIEGKSLLPILEGSQQSELHDFIFSETFYHEHIVAVRSADYLYTLNLNKDTEELFHHPGDPWCQDDLISAKRQDADRLREKILEHLSTSEKRRNKLEIEQNQVAEEDWREISKRLRALGYVGTPSSSKTQDAAGSAERRTSWVSDRPVWRSLSPETKLISRGDPRISIGPLSDKLKQSGRWVQRVQFPHIPVHYTSDGRIAIEDTFSQAILIFLRTAWSASARIAVDGKVAKTVDLRISAADPRGQQYPILLDGLENKHHVITVDVEKNAANNSGSDEVILQAVLLM